MKRRRWIAGAAAALIAAAVLLPGCNGVWLSAEYTRLLNDTADLSAETARRAQAGTLPSGDMRDALVYQADVWRQFQHGLNGTKADVLPDVDSPAAATQAAPLTSLAPAVK